MTGQQVSRIITVLQILCDRIVSNSIPCGITCLLGKLNVPAETVQHVVEGLMFILTESSKLMVRAFTFVMSWGKNKYSM